MRGYRSGEGGEGQEAAAGSSFRLLVDSVMYGRIECCDPAASMLPNMTWFYIHFC